MRSDIEKAKVLIVEDHESMQESLAAALSETGEFTVVGKISSADHAEIFCERLKPDLVFMDVCTEGGASGLKVAQILRQKYPDMKIIIMTAFDEISYMPRAKSIGANGFVYKSRSLAHFVETARKVMTGEFCFPEPKIIPMPDGEAPLTDREMEVLRLMCKHMNNTEIAKELFITENTVKFHKKNMLLKTGFTKTVDLAFYMIANGWINPLY